MTRHTSGRTGTCRGLDVLCEDDEVGMGRLHLPKWAAAAIGLPFAAPAIATAAAVAAPAVVVASTVAPLLPTVAGAAVIAPDEIKNLGEKFNIGDHSEDWKKWAKGFVDVSTLGASRDKHVRDAVKDLGEKWNVGNNSVDTLKSMVNVASIVGALSGVGTLASAMLGSSTLTQGAMTAAKEYVRQSLKEKIIGKAGEELADPYIDHLIRKARRDQAALVAEEQALIDQYKEQRPGVYSLMMMAVENPNAMTQEQIQVIVNYQRDLERERALAENKAVPSDEDWVNYYTRFLAEYGVVWNPTENPGMVFAIGGGLPPKKTTSLAKLVGNEINFEKEIRLQTAYFADVAKQPREKQSLSFSPELQAALDSLYPQSQPRSV